MSGTTETDRKESLGAVRARAIRMVTAALEELPSQHPLDADVLASRGPGLNDSVSLRLYRTVRLLAFREVLGAKLAASVLYVSGRNVGRGLNLTSLDGLAAALNDFSLGRVSIQPSADESAVITIEDCATCSGVPAIGERLCHFEGGIIAGSMEAVLGTPVEVEEVRCWGLGDSECRWHASPSDALHEAGSLTEVVDFIGKTASAIDRSSIILQKNQQLRDTLSRLRESERLRRDLTDMIVHDLRVPLTAITGSVHTLLDIAESEFSPQQRELLGMALNSGDSLLQMINDLLDISRLEENRLQLRRKSASVSLLVENAVNQVSVLASRKRQKVATRLPESLLVAKMDPDRMHRVLVNLLSNAVKHTPSGGRITIGAEVCADGSEIIVRVSDNGEGIPLEYQTRIFDKFVQVESAKSRRRGSSGLGLSFCKLVTEAHGGRIWVDSEPGFGSTFSLSIPTS